MAEARPRPSARGATSPQLLGLVNDQLVLELLIERGPLTRGQIGKSTGLSKPTVSALLDRLQSRDLVESAGVVSRGPGPKANLFRIQAMAGLVVGIHVEQYGSVAALSTLTGEHLARHSVDVPDRSVSHPRDEVRSAIDGLVHASGVDESDIDLIALATPGVIDPATESLHHAQHLQGWEEPGLRATLARDIGIPVMHGNDVNLTAIAERLHGAATGHDDFALIWLDRGVGLGIVTRGRLHTGAHGGAGEIGYLPSPGIPNSARIDIGETGPFQRLVGGQGIRDLALQYGLPGVSATTSPAETISAAVCDSARGQELLDELAGRIAAGAAAVTALLDPGLLVLGGPVAAAGGSHLLAAVQRELAERTFVPTETVLSRLQGDGVLTGAVHVALERVRAHLFGRADVPSSITGAY